ncbi:hypothetical protein TNCV_3191441 [Trichonephila clavipes]|nr:hypothetical protein TNCV_3191441 [Trichonephila clavipes]
MSGDASYSRRNPTGNMQPGNMQYLILSEPDTRNNLGMKVFDLVEKYCLCLDNEHIRGGDHGCIPEIMDGILTTARDLELEVNEDDIEELIMGHGDELTTELQKF